jgi:hypothetical protein
MTFIFGCSNTLSQQNTVSSIASKDLNNSTRQLLLGTWCGEKKHENGVLQKWIVYRESTGLYKIDFKTVDTNNVVNNWSEFGIWGVRYPIYFTIVQGFDDGNSVSRANTADPDLYDAYNILNVNKTSFTYNSFASGNTFTINRKCKNDSA